MHPPGKAAAPVPPQVPASIVPPPSTFSPASWTVFFFSQQFGAAIRAGRCQHIATVQTEPAPRNRLSARGTDRLFRQYPGPAIGAEPGVIR